MARRSESAPRPHPPAAAVAADPPPAAVVAERPLDGGHPGAAASCGGDELAAKGAEGCRPDAGPALPGLAAAAAAAAATAVAAAAAAAAAAGWVLEVGAGGGGRKSAAIATAWARAPPSAGYSWKSLSRALWAERVR
jgi:hypothetical protein